MKTLYGKNPFLIVNNKPFLLSCQSPILIFQNIPLAFLMQWGNFVPLGHFIAGGADDVKAAAWRGRAGALTSSVPPATTLNCAAILKGIYQIVQHYFFCPAPDAVHFLKPAQPVIGFKLLRHALFPCHLPYKPVHHPVAFFINFRKMLP